MILGPPAPLEAPHTAREIPSPSPILVSRDSLASSGSLTSRLPQNPGKSIRASAEPKATKASRERRWSPIGARKEARGAMVSLKGNENPNDINKALGRGGGAGVRHTACVSAIRVLRPTGARPTNEDWHAQGDTRCGKYSVLLLCDGHGGKQTAAVQNRHLTLSLDSGLVDMLTPSRCVGRRSARFCSVY